MTDLAKLKDDLSKLTVLEAAELAKMLEEAWGVTAAAAVAVAAAPAAAGGAAAPAADAQTEFKVVLTKGGDKVINVIKVLREVNSALGLADAKKAAEGAAAAPYTVKEGLKKDEAEAIVKKLTEAGATAKLE